MTPADADALVRQLVCGDPAAASSILGDAVTSTEPLVLTAAALLDQRAPWFLTRAIAVAVRAEDRQVIAVADAHLAGDRDRVSALAREHLLEHPGSVLVAWIAAGAPTSRPTRGENPTDSSKELS
jgi:hypothetical protein